LSIKFKENSTVAKYSGTLIDFGSALIGNNISLPFTNTYSNSIVQVSLGGLVMTEDMDFIINANEILLYERGIEYINDNVTIIIFKQQSYGGGL